MKKLSNSTIIGKKRKKIAENNVEICTGIARNGVQSLPNRTKHVRLPPILTRNGGIVFTLGRNDLARTRYFNSTVRSSEMVTVVLPNSPNRIDLGSISTNTQSKWWYRVHRRSELRRESKERF
nr:hypothetical protein Iba_chr14aCG5790 [Ipomoea batatas]